MAECPRNAPGQWRRIRNLNDLLEMLEEIAQVHDKSLDSDESPRRLGVEDDDSDILFTCPMCHNNAKYACSNCSKICPNPFMLDLHITEAHDPLFSIKAKKEPSYRCYIQECSAKFMSPSDRLKHGIKDHGMPKYFKYDWSLNATRNTPNACKHSSDTSDDISQNMSMDMSHDISADLSEDISENVYHDAVSLDQDESDLESECAVTWPLERTSNLPGTLSDIEE